MFNGFRKIKYYLYGLFLNQQVGSFIHWTWTTDVLGEYILDIGILHTSCEAQLRKCSHHDPEIADMCTALAGQLQSLITDRHKRKKKVYKSKEHLSI